MQKGPANSSGTAKSQPVATASKPSQFKESDFGKQLEAAIFPNGSKSDIITEKNKQIASLQQELAEGLFTITMIFTFI